MSDDTQAVGQPYTIERHYTAPLAALWALWATEKGLESWWGPEGFKVTVHDLDLRPGGELRYAMTATAPEQVAFMSRAGMPLTTEALLTFTRVSPQAGLAYRHRVDFVPGVAPYDVATRVEFLAAADGVTMTLSLDAMHADEWTERAVMGWESQLGKLERAIGERGAAR